VRGGSWPASTRWRSCSRETLERVQFDITTAKARASWKCKRRRRCGCKRTRSSRGKREREKKQKKSALRAVLKGTGLTLHLRCRAHRDSKTFARARHIETTACNRDASIPATCRLAEPARGLDGAVTSVTSAEMPAPTTAPTSPLRP
jgi:type IV secretory pathway VirJ component